MSGVTNGMRGMQRCIVGYHEKMEFMTNSCASTITPTCPLGAEERSSIYCAPLLRLEPAPQILPSAAASKEDRTTTGLKEVEAELDNILAWMDRSTAASLLMVSLAIPFKTDLLIYTSRE